MYKSIFNKKQLISIRGVSIVYNLFIIIVSLLVSLFIRMAKRTLIFLFLTISSLCLFSQDATSTRGKEFWLGFMRNLNLTANEELKVFVTSDVSTSGTLSIPLQGFNVNFNVIANTTTTITVPNNLAEEQFSEAVSNKGILIETLDTVAVFAVNYEPASADGSKVLPTPTLGTNYRITSYHGPSSEQFYNGSEFLIVATEDNTEIEINLSAESRNGILPNQPYIISLNRGESYQVRSKAEFGTDLTGSTIKGTDNNGNCRPFAVFSGSACADIPTGCSFCDHVFDQNFPVNTWGTEFYIVPNEITEVYTVTFLADQDNTNISIDNVTNFQLQAGQYTEFNNISTPLCISSDKGINVTQFFQGTNCSNGGDPAMLIQNDNTQKIKNITFSTVEIDTTGEHGLNIITSSTAISSIFLNGTLINPSEFSPFLACPDQSFAQLTIATGSHTLNSINGFTAYVFGSGDNESYAYSVGSHQPVIEIIDSVICTNNEIILEANPLIANPSWVLENNTEDTLFWGNPYILTIPIVPGLYIANGLDPNSGCEVETKFLVETPEGPALTPYNIEACRFEEFTFQNTIEPATGFYDYEWSPALTFSESDILNPSGIATTSTTYDLTISSLSDCFSPLSASINVDVLGGNYYGITALVTPEKICIGEDVLLSGSINEIVIEDNFEPNISWTNWCNILNGSVSNSCGSVSGSALYFNGTGIRSCTTDTINTSAGGTIVFSLKIANGVTPCDDVDPGEDVVLEYSTNGCFGSYSILETFYEFAYPEFEQIIIQIPPAAQSPETHFRWRQLNNSGGNSDNWMIDDIFISTYETTGLDLTWSSTEPIDSPNIPSTTSTPLSSTTYYLDVVDLESNCIYSDSASVEVNPAVSFTLPLEQSFCSQTQYTIEPEVSTVGDYIFDWNSSDGLIDNINTINLTVTPNTSTDYELEITDTITNCSFISEISIIVNELAGIQISTPDSTLCYGDSTLISLDVYGNSIDYSIDWSINNPYTLIDSTHVFSSSTNTSTFIATVIDLPSGCSYEDSLTVHIAEHFTIEAPQSVSTCNAISLELETIVTGVASSELDWTWEPQVGFDVYDQPNFEITENNNITYSVTATNEYNCFETDNFSIEIVEENLDLGEDISLCSGETYLIITGYDSIYNSFEWNNGMEGSELIVTEEGIYGVAISNELGCYTSDSINVLYHNLPILNLGQDNTACINDTILLDLGDVDETIQWNTGQTNSTITINQSGCYSATLTNEYGCANSDTVCYTYHILPNTILVDSIFSCTGDEEILDAGNEGESYQWNTGEETPILIVSQSGTYSVLITNEFDCSIEASTVIEFGELPFVVLPQDQSLCVGDTLHVVAETDSDILQWNNGETSDEIIVTTSGAYILTVYNQFCESNDEINVVFNTYPQLTLPENLTICFDDYPQGYELNPGGNFGSIFDWNTGATTSSIQTYSPGYYRVVSKGSFGCQSSADIFIYEFCSGINIFIPNAFTPNNDGINDVFRIKGNNIALYSIKIYNRWGQQIWHSTDIGKPWDGSYKSRDHWVQNDIYTYIIEYSSFINSDGLQSQSNTIQGKITVIR